ncbi:GNAT family N-acetyltransferase [Cocleimonas sp. KMM 6892]|uniref:GNAT family N-acetyltransferase n=1 Tax=unclassified Cocleimonas TaxID=2639732 RepID=UPI002DB985B0|nr:MULTISPECIES: GNAT family N-acetyltransferase [unclassified Cocleimonas]MEB8432534.1 GNAT family N-acetyltransferase [Cocleimonas sp. KMM 6892]MEC4715393.1 GNAT family N-acetyltransferase [Cocleimonas sp. KMM 6895]MEC4744988.1 GNAT family N-acetyltransferase [Cocleimonas sp. KMM 6896]
MNLIYRNAEEGDLSKLIEMLADDQLGAHREDSSTPVNQAYIDALKVISDDPNNELIVAERSEDSDTYIVGMLQLTYIPYLTYKGSWRCLIEGVRVHKDHRSKGYGKQLFEWSIKRAKVRGCNIVQLTSNKQRSDAIRFYNDLGFKASHEGFKLMIEN